MSSKYMKTRIISTAAFLGSMVLFGSSLIAQTKQDSFTNASGIEFVKIRAGEFMMGSNNGPSQERPVRKVKIRKEFWIGKYEITQEQFTAIMGTNPSYFKKCPKCPVEMVSWDDAKSFISKLNSKGDGYTYSLPSEAQWEYAARSGTTTEYAFGDKVTPKQLNNAYMVNKPTPVGTYPANAWGIFDMHGNVWEWCEDVQSYDYNKLPADESPNLTIGEDKKKRIMRGGAWYGTAGEARSAMRNGFAQTYKDYQVGFRLVAIVK